MFRIVLQQIAGLSQPFENVADSILIDHFPYVIGRHGSCDYQLHEPQISRWHCRFVDAGTEVQISDLESHNGTILNNQRVLSPHPVLTGDILILGRCQFRIDVQCIPSPWEQMPPTRDDLETTPVGG